MNKASFSKSNSFEAGDGKSMRRPYEKPAEIYSEPLEEVAAGCGKLSPTAPDLCAPPTPNS